jgi:hypothetical protein
MAGVFIFFEKDCAGQTTVLSRKKSIKKPFFGYRCVFLFVWGIFGG